jgi:hypothetical protein
VARQKGYSLYSKAKEGNIFVVIRWRQISTSKSSGYSTRDWAVFLRNLLYRFS